MSLIKRIFHFISIRIIFLIRKTYWNNKIIKNSLNSEKRNFNIIVSLTSFPARTKYLYITIKSLMVQNLKPDRIILYLGTDTTKEILPKKLLQLQKLGLEIIYNKENLKPHKKYVFAAQENPNSYLITVDDDLIYDKDLIEDLWKTHLKYPNCVCARRVHLMKKNQNEILPYNQWETESSKITTPSFALFSTNGAGTLFPPECFDSTFLDKNKIKELCLDADDIWIKFNLIRKKIPIVWTGRYAYMPKEIFYPKNKNVTLMSQNVTKNKNDEYIEKLQKFFNINLIDYCD